MPALKLSLCNTVLGHSHKKGRPKSPKLPCVPLTAESALLALVRILPDEITDTSEEGDHQADSADTGENYDIDKHGCLLL